MRNVLYLGLLGVVLITIALVVRSGMLARSNPGEPINAAMREAMETKSQGDAKAGDEEIIRQKYPGATKTPTGLAYVVKSPGTGETAQSGDEVVVHYDGRLLDGTPFDSSYRRGAPITFRVGTGMVIKGWDEAFKTMRKGEKRTLIVPYWLGYGMAGRPPTIPARATLVFDVELIDIR